MTGRRVEAITNGLIAIIMTITVLGLKAPTGTNPEDLWAEVPILLV
ncbi:MULTISPECIES: TMEM175 family protein [Sphingomonas]|nr:MULTISPECIES: TMEM175 family protein [Sphingomonas]